MAENVGKSKRSLSDLADQEWQRIAPLMPGPGHRGRLRQVAFREVINEGRATWSARAAGGGCCGSVSITGAQLSLVPRTGAALPF